MSDYTIEGSEYQQLQEKYAKALLMLEAMTPKLQEYLDLLAAFKRLASISAWGCVWFNTTEPATEENHNTDDMYRVEIHTIDNDGERLAHESGNDLIETIERALLAYEAQRIKPSMEAGMKWAEKRMRELGLLGDESEVGE